MANTTDTTKFKAYPPEKKGMVLGDFDDSTNVINVLVKLPAKLHKKLQKDYYCEEMTEILEFVALKAILELYTTDEIEAGKVDGINIKLV